MICPKCNSQNQNGNFCGNCSNLLREKCGECGNMEPIGRLVCQSKLWGSRSDLALYVIKRTRWCINMMLSAYFVCLILVIIMPPFAWIKWGDDFWLAAVVGQIHQFLSITEGWEPLFWIFGFLLIFIVLPITLLSQYMDRKKKQAQEEFLQNNPEKAELLKKAKGEVDAS